MIYFKSYDVKFLLHKWNKQHSAYIELWLGLQSLATLKIDELLFTTNSAKLSHLTIWRIAIKS